MTALYIPREAFDKPSQWEVNGVSPSNSPAAVMQQAQLLLSFAGNPVIGKFSGLEIYALIKAILTNGALKNAKGVQCSKAELDARLSAPPPALVPPGSPPALGGPGGPSGGPNLGATAG